MTAYRKIKCTIRRLVSTIDHPLGMIAGPPGAAPATSMNVKTYLPQPLLFLLRKDQILQGQEANCDYAPLFLADCVSRRETGVFDMASMQIIKSVEGPV